MHQGTFQDINGFGASPDGLGATVHQHPPLPPLQSMRGFGADDTVLAPTQFDSAPSALRRTIAIAYGLASIAGAATGAYHGYRRNHESLGWALGWAFLGSLVPIVTIPVSIAQGFGEPKRGR